MTTTKEGLARMIRYRRQEMLQRYGLVSAREFAPSELKMLDDYLQLAEDLIVLLDPSGHGYHYGKSGVTKPETEEA